MLGPFGEQNTVWYLIQYLLFAAIMYICKKYTESFTAKYVALRIDTAY